VGKRIFVVDSQTEVCRLARECLEGAGYAVHVVSPGEVVSEARIKQPSLILISLTSESAGLELCRRLHDDPLLAKTALVFLLHSGIEEPCSGAILILGKAPFAKRRACPERGRRNLAIGATGVPNTPGFGVGGGGWVAFFPTQ
jgi:CheY-like chemotaxis protein